ncbi:MAG: hypothetical protein GXO90_11580 [FCB group bacterium]|nr:hypothetical protein [FCB group bacterium]
MVTRNTPAVIRLTLVTLATLPVYLYIILEKAAGHTHFTVADLLGWQLLIISAGLLLLFGMSRFTLTIRFKDLSPGSGTPLLDISTGFVLLISIYFIESIGRLTYYQWLPQSGPDRTELIQSLRAIAASPVYSIIWLGPITLLGQLFLELTRTLFLKSFWDFSQKAVWHWMPIIVFAMIVSLLGLDRGWPGIISGFTTSLIFNLTYYWYRRLNPLLVASIIYQYLNVSGLWLH